MADRYWVGGSGNWNSTNTGNWSATSGGSSGASAPVSGDDVFFDANSDSGAGFTVTIVATGPTIRNLTISGLDQAMILAGTVGIAIQGNISLPASNFTWSGTGTLTLSGSSSSRTILTNGVTINGDVTFNSSGSDWTLQSALTVGSNDNVTLTAGTLDTAGYAVSCQLFVISGTTTRTLTLGASAITCTGSGNAWNATTTTNLTLNAGTSNITMSRNASSKTFAGGGLTYNILSQGGSGTLIITGANTFADIQNPYKTTGATIIDFTSGVTQTVSAFTASGEAGRVLTIESTVAASAATLSKASGSVTVAYCSIKDLTATGGATWNATNSTNVSGNTGWNFVAAGFTLTADAGSFALNGQAAGLLAARKLPAAYGAFSLNGQAAGLKYGRNLAAVSGSFALNGQSITLTYSGAGPKVMVADAGVFSLAGQTLTLRHNRTVTAGLGAFALDGQNVSLAYSGGYRLGADAGQFALTGQTVGLAIGQFWAVQGPTSETWTATTPNPAVWTVQ
jgi:hypothetical protein